MFLTEEQYDRVLALLDGKIEKSPLLQEWIMWMKEKYGVEVYDYICDTTNNGLTRLKIVVWDNFAQKRFRNGVNYDSLIQKECQDKFAELARKYGVHPDYQDENKIFVCWDTLKDQIVTHTISAARERILALQKDDIWNMYFEGGSVHIFYETKQQVAQHEKDGKNEVLRRSISEIVRKYDTYKLFTEGVNCVFISHETLNEEYQGNMFYYYAR